MAQLKAVEEAAAGPRPRGGRGADPDQSGLREDLDTLSFTRTATAPVLKDAADVVEVLARLTGERPGDPGRAAEAVTTSATLSGEQT